MKTLPTKPTIIGLTIFLIGLFLGWLLHPDGSDTPSSAVQSPSSTPDVQLWTCSMHPQIRQPEPGKCPICGMDLIPLQSSEQEEISTGIQLSQRELQLANIQFATAQRKSSQKVLRLPAVVAPDEDRLIRLTAHVPSSRIEKLYITFEGAFVQANEPIAKIYSPEIIAAHRELLVALRNRQQLGQLLETIRQKFRNWKFTEAQIAALERSDTLQSIIDILSPISGHVLKLNVREGDHPMEGEVIAEIADLSTVWVWLDVYEQNIPFIRVGTPITFEFDAVPGKRFRGTISYIEPTVNEQTRSVQARVELANPTLQLRPGMYGVATVTVQAAESIVIPKTAVLWTGERSFVYVKVKESEGNVWVEPRQVRLGAELKDEVEIIEGLNEGEVIVKHGTFVVDASAQLAGLTSMMNPSGQGTIPTHHHGSHQPEATRRSSQSKKLSRSTVSMILSQYNHLYEALVRSSLSDAQSAIQKLIEHVHQTPELQQQRSLLTILHQMEQAPNLKTIRKEFDRLSRTLHAVLQHQPLAQTLYWFQCPMAFDNQEGYWLSTDPRVRNPYFGDQMLECGSIIDTLKSQ